MPEAKYRIRMITGWTGTVDGEKRHAKAGEEVDVDMVTCRALVFQHEKAEMVSVEEIIAKTKPKKKPTGKRASRTRAQTKPGKDKMQRSSTQKGE